MRFTRLRLTGFKSFVDPTELRIDEGLTGVVGPNGCGKSNLLEALRWVMGESSPKSLRGAGMEDVIFAGTSLRPARSYAEVALLVDNHDRRAPAQFNHADDLEISRRIERELGSVYRVNGKDARQRDIQTMFADAASGAHSPSIVSQGRIGAVINAKPADRRAILEEAAGIGGLHARRNEAELRLRAAEGNLSRLDDLMAQLETQATSLRRQSRQAERYRHLSAEIRLAEAALLFQRWQDATNAHSQAQAALADVSRIVDAATVDATRLATAQAEKSARLPELRQAEAEAAAAWQRMRLMVDQLAADAARVTARQAELARQLETLARDQEREVQLASDATGALERLAAEQTDVVARIERSRAEQARHAEQVTQAEQAASEGERAFDTLTQAHADGMAQRRALQTQIEAARTRITRLAEDLARSAAERDRLEADGRTAEAQAAEQQLQASLAARDEADGRINAAEQRRTDAEASREQALAAERDAAAQVSQIRAEQAGLERLLAQPFGESGQPILDRLTVKPGYEPALGAALADDLAAPLGGDGARRWTEAAPVCEGDPALPDGCQPLSTCVSGPPALTRRLAQIGVIDKAATPEQVAALAVGQRLVSLAGDVWRWDGFVVRANAQPAAAARLAQRNRLTETAAELTQAETALTAARTARAAAQEALNATQAEEQAARTARRQAEQAELAARKTLTALEQALRQRDARLASLKESASRIEEDRAAREADLAAATAQLEALGDLERLSLQLADQRKIVERLRADLASARGQLDALTRQIAADSTRLRTIETDAEAWRKRIASGSSQREELDRRKAAAQSELDVLADRPATIEAERTRLAAQMHEGEALRAAAADRLAELESALRAVETDLRRAQETLASAREQRARLETQSEHHAERRQELAMTIGEQFQCPPPLLPERLGIEDAAALPAADLLEGRLEKLRAERERLGAVNLRADVELAEIEATLETNTREKAELVEAINKLRGSIGALNREGRQRLLEAFDRVDAHFRELFTTLFGGGSAHLALTETDDPLDAGLEIMASPPGKKLQHLGLLSGGEQALTAIALIFAVFLTNPAPVCVLDEVDAPLDDANVERFCDLLQAMTQRTATRFLIVTHNAVTMSRMDRLFGVTMAERGVSQLVSVDLGHAERLAAE